jgi:hypothetical protein
MPVVFQILFSKNIFQPGEKIMPTYHVKGSVEKTVELDIDAKNEEEAWDQFCDQADEEIMGSDWEKENSERMPNTRNIREPWEPYENPPEESKGMKGTWKIDPSHTLAIGPLPQSALKPAPRPTDLKKQANVTVGDHKYRLFWIAEGLKEFGVIVNGDVPALFYYGNILAIKPVPGDLCIIVAESVID